MRSLRSRRVTALVLVAAILIVAAVPTALQLPAVASPGWTAFEYVAVHRLAFAPVTSTYSPTELPDSISPRGPPLS